ncbi:2OG-Fe(II) oxygenase [Aquisalinus flavus]|uniref:Prolyl 4-hydroxylase alpha subunit domain-containing protein n=1 Tax=Aquisalinus flavus TaxID=1526572 RepID=A0A8J2V3P8_9PROT|nr:2OG-Fe(II) oxygenase [Aquisalinus flavus]MBD0426793.1 2OG-Fe(II) oxygenase [Aquisalinus flavus]UNE46644.1 2OG-Fe(II) oxygenase [Aquisalinus flavus]GGC96055.1 hypothetical protein GCM10011342_01050 [Aquisalinus flavus]
MSLAPAIETEILPFDVAGLCDDLARQGWSVRSLARRKRLIGALRQELALHRAEEALAPAGIGRSDDFRLARSIRRDRILWLDGDSIAQKAYLAFAEKLRVELNRRLMLGLFRYEAHFALYEAGGFYKMHRDSFAGARNRLVSTVLYLNEDWQGEDGGLLRLFAEDEKTILQEVVPAMATFAVFLSEEVPHEVTVALKARASIAGWFRCNDLIETPALQGAGLADRL